MTNRDFLVRRRVNAKNKSDIAFNASEEITFNDQSRVQV
jgi:hypothetical protein